MLGKWGFGDDWMREMRLFQSLVENVIWGGSLRMDGEEVHGTC